MTQYVSHEPNSVAVLFSFIANFENLKRHLVEITRFQTKFLSDFLCILSFRAFLCRFVSVYGILLELFCRD